MNKTIGMNRIFGINKTSERRPVEKKNGLCLQVDQVDQVDECRR